VRGRGSANPLEHKGVERGRENLLDVAIRPNTQKANICGAPESQCELLLSKEKLGVDDVVLIHMCMLLSEAKARKSRSSKR